MGLIDLRDLLSFPSNGDNSTDSVINGVHFNLTALNLFNYAIYDNGTISNASKCYLIFNQYQPHMLYNGSWINGTSCYLPYYGIQTRGSINIAFAALFGISIMFTLLNLRKHGRMFIREEKRFRIIGRRWSWYWMLFVAACGMISCVTGIDVDRDYLQDIAIILQSFFYTLMVPGTLAIVWEATRHWGSWQERQIYDRDPFALPQDDRRGRTEFYLPLIFYLFAWLNFFMTVPRSWTAIKLQRSPEQQESEAEPAATDIRFKVGAIIAAAAWAVIIFSLHHSLKHYKPRGETILRRINNFCHFCPTKLFLALVVLAIRLGYGIACTWIWEINIMKFDGEPGWPYGLGYGTTLLIVAIFEIAGWQEENEDKQLIKQRHQRGMAADAELGLVKKPNWWSKSSGDRFKTAEDRLRAMTTEIGGGQPTGRRMQEHVELGTMNFERTNSVSHPPPYTRQDPFRDSSPNTGTRLEAQRSASVAASDGTRTSDQTLGGNSQPQVIRSMLDV